MSHEPSARVFNLILQFKLRNLINQICGTNVIRAGVMLLLHYIIR